MSRRERLWISMLLIALAATATPAYAADGPWQSLEGIWSWLTEVVWPFDSAPGPLSDQCASIDPNGGCRLQASATSEQSIYIDPDGGSNATSEQGGYIDPNG